MLGCGTGFAEIFPDPFQTSEGGLSALGQKQLVGCLVVKNTAAETEVVLMCLQQYSLLYDDQDV